MSSLRRLLDEDAVGQLVRRDGQMKELGSEGGTVKLDWVDETERLLADPAALTSVEEIARGLWERGVRRVVWSGMGGSVLTVRVLAEVVGGGAVAVYPLDSTDPGAIDAALDWLGDDLHDTHLIAVAMGLTSEEPISHLDWYVSLLAEGGADPRQHVTVLTLPGSYLEAHAIRHGYPTGPVYLGDRSGFPGRMSAPSTLVFLLPVALQTAGTAPGTLHAVLDRAWRDHDLAGAQAQPGGHPFVRLAADLSDASVDGCCRLLLTVPQTMPSLLTWVEQVLEQCLGKGGRGVAVFVDRGEPATVGTQRLSIGHDLPGDDRVTRLAALATTFLGWQLCAAMYGYLHGIRVVDEPAVEIYKAHARRLRELPDPLAALGRPERVLGPSDAAVVAGAVADMSYVDITVNGEPAPATWERLEHRVRAIVGLLGVPVKLRRAPAGYHVSEQSEMDGPGPMISLRTVRTRPATVRRGTYADRFLPAQAVATWRAMNEQGRPCFLLLLDDHEELDPFLGDLAELIAAKEEN